MGATHTTPWTHEGREYEVRWRIGPAHGQRRGPLELVGVREPGGSTDLAHLNCVAEDDLDLWCGIAREACAIDDAAREDAEERRAEQRRDERRGL